MQSRQQVVVVFFALRMVGGCSGSGGDKSIPLADLPPRLAQALCAAYESCYGPTFELFLNGADCVTTTEQRIRNGTFPMLQAEIDRGKVVYDSSKTQACLGSLSTRTCSQLLERDSPECLAALDGTVPLGGACALDEECQGLAVCKSSTGTCPGQCTALFGAGQACVQDGDCQSGLQCSSETELCVAPGAEAQACAYGTPPCGPGLLCVGRNDENGTPGTCTTPAAALSAPVGGVCDPTKGPLCQAGSSCVVQSVDVLAETAVWSCMAAGTFLAGGECRLGFPDACAAGYYCKTGGDVFAVPGGMCTPLPASGAPCGTPIAPCQLGTVCVSGICQAMVPNGVSCTGDAMCFSGDCGSGGGCEPRVPCN